MGKGGSTPVEVNEVFRALIVVSLPELLKTMFLVLFLVADLSSLAKVASFLFTLESKTIEHLSTLQILKLFVKTFENSQETKEEDYQASGHFSSSYVVLNCEIKNKVVLYTAVNE